MGDSVVAAGGSLTTSRTACAALNPSRRMAVTLGVTIVLTMIPVTMLVPVLKELVATRFHASPFWTHAFMFINLVGAVLAAPIGGAIADRYRQRTPILVFALLLDAGLFLLMTRATSLAELLGLRFLEGAAHILALTTVMAIASDWATPERRGRMMGLIGGSLMLGTSLGAPLGGRLGQVDASRVLVYGALTAVVCAIIACIGIQDAPRRRSSGRLRDALLLLRRHRKLAIPYAYAAIDRFCVGVIVSTFVLFLGDVHELSPAGRGGLLAFFLFPMALLCYPVGRFVDRWGRAKLITIGSVGFGLLFASYGYLPTSWLPAAMVLSGVFSAIMFAPNLVICADMAPVDSRATAFAGFNAAGSLGFIAGPLIGGTLLSVYGTADGIPLFVYRAAFIGAGLAQVLCVALTLPFFIKSARRASRSMKTE